MVWRSTAIQRSRRQPREFSESRGPSSEPGEKSRSVRRWRVVSWALWSSWNPTTSARLRLISSATRAARTGPEAISGRLPVLDVWLAPRTFKELSTKSRLGGGSGVGSGVGAAGSAVVASVAAGVAGGVREAGPARHRGVGLERGAAGGVVALVVPEG